MSCELETHEAPTITIRSGLDLIASVPESDRARFAAKVAAMSEVRAVNLLPRIQTTTDPATMWALHMEFHRRGTPPSLRGPRHELGPQGDHLDLCADLMWLRQRWSYHRPRYKLARQLFSEEPDSPAWHSLALAFSASAKDTRGRVIALALDSWQRLDLRSLADASTRRRFDSLHGERFGQLLDALTAGATERPDKSGAVTPTDTARRRALLWRIHELTGRNHQTTADQFTALTGQPIKRQMVARHIAATVPIVAELEKQRRLASEPHFFIP
jgi:hypothetical protein